MGKYTSLNVLSKNFEDRLVQEDSIDQVARMINQSGKNRSQRRRLERQLGRVQTVMSQCQKRVDKSAYKEYQDRLDENFLHFFATLAIVLKEDYHWREDETHDQITSLMDRMNAKLNKYANMKYTTDDIVKVAEELTGVQFVPDSH